MNIAEVMDLVPAPPDRTPETLERSLDDILDIVLRIEARLIALEELRAPEIPPTDPVEDPR